VNDPGVTGVILVGGKSRRMGRDKALLEINGRTLFETTLAAFREALDTVILVGDRPERFAGSAIPIYPDIYPGSALGGLYTGLVRAETSHIFVSSCDLPYPSPAIIRRLVELAPANDVVVPETAAGYEPLFAVYSQECREPIRRQLEDGNFCVYDFYPQVRTRVVTADELAGLADLDRCFLNLNTPEEFRRIVPEEPLMPVKVVSFVAKSGTGKTTLLEKVIVELKHRGYRVGAIKHDAHKFDIDHPGKDSHRLTAAGADTMLISSPEKLALVKKHAAPPPIEELLATYFADVDIVITEGFKKSGLPKIEIYRKERSPTLLCRGEEHDPTLVAVASDEPLDLDVPVLDLNDAVQVADFVVERFIG
jgi:molybdopterin-guanine dinucleotide biosynthesis protein B/molybdopterin-guanine dinucleotide biosynthesis protein